MKICRAHHSIIAPKQHSCLQKNITTIKSRWPRFVQFDQADLNLRPPIPETNAFPLDQLAVGAHNQKYGLSASENRHTLDLLKTLSIIGAPYG